VTVVDSGGSPITPPSPTHLTAARNHACALYAEGGSIMCWGEPTGLFDAATTTPQPARLAQIFYDLLAVTTPILLSADVTAAGVCVRNEEYTTRREPIIHCGGDDTHHELGGAATSVDPIPFYWSTEVAVGATHRCALSADHLVSCWGGGGAGQLGVLPSTLGTCGTDACSAVAQPIQNVLFASLATSGDSDTTCGIVTNASAPGQVTCWGANGEAQTGRFASPYSVVTTPPSFVALQGGAPLTRIQRLAVGPASACAIDDQERLFCWGMPIGVFVSPPPGSAFATEVVIRGGP
jgi:hypothetical protein